MCKAATARHYFVNLGHAPCLPRGPPRPSAETATHKETIREVQPLDFDREGTTSSTKMGRHGRPRAGRACLMQVPVTKK